MFIPIVFSLTPSDHDLVYTWIFLKSLDFAKRYHWPVIAQARYFNEWEKMYNTYPIYGTLTKEWSEIFEYDIPRKSDLRKIIPIEIPCSIEQDYINRFPSETDAFLAAVTDEWPEMESFLFDAIQNTEKNNNQKTQALMAIADFAFINNIGKKLGIPVIHYEWSSIRFLHYEKKLLFMDFKGLAGNSELEERYHKFHKNAANVPVLSRKEILALFLKKNDLRYLIEEENVPLYEFGMACTTSWPGWVSAFSRVTNIEMYTRILRLFREEDIYVRNHPGDSGNCVINEAKHVSNGSIFDFILKSKRIISIGSNISFDAALFNRPVYDLGYSHYKMITNTDLEKLEDHIPTDEQLSFITFCFFLPYELFWTKEYLFFRLSNPSEKELYMFHLSYYLKSLSLEDGILSLPQEERLKTIIAKRMDEQRPIEIIKTKGIMWNQESDYLSWYIKFHQLSNALSVLEEKTNRLETRNREFETKNQEFEARNRELEAKNQELEARNPELEARNQELEAKNRELEAKNRELGTKNQELELQNNSLEMRDMDSQKSLASLQQQLNLLTNSRSYKITRPLRETMAFIQKVKNNKH
jgi:hypothetical protein